MKKHRFLAVLLFIVIISRIPLLVGGFGADGDGWRVAKSSLTLWNTGEYNISRFPGFPAYEILQAPLIGLGGSFASNSATLIVFIISLVIFRKIITQWNIPNANILVVTYAFLPILWKNSALTMDYVWGLCGILAALLLLIKKRFLVAGILLGLAAGTRISHIVYFIPFFFLFERTERKQWFIFSATAVTTMFICYLPVALSPTYQQIVTDYVADVRQFPQWKRFAFFSYRFIFSIGLLGFFSVIVIFLFNSKKIATLLKEKSFVVSMATVVIALVVFAILSDEREYLIPMMPFLLIVVGMFAARTQLIVTSALLISYAFISVDLIEHSVASPQPKIHFQQGFVLKEWNDRKTIERGRTALANAPLPDSSVVMMGMGPLFWLENPAVEVDYVMEREFRADCARSKLRTEVYYIYALYQKQLQEFRRRGYRIYYWDTMKDYLETFIGYKLDDEKIEPLRTNQTQK